MNNYSFTGNIGQSADIRYLASGDPVAGFSVAIRSGFGKNENTFWANCSIFGKRAESIAPYLVKGQQVAIVGEVNIRKYQTKDGQEKQSFDVRVNDLTLVGNRAEHQTQAPVPAQENNGAYGIENDADLPF